MTARVKEPAGLWLQGCGGWDDQDQQVASRWWAGRDLFGSDSEQEGRGKQGGAAQAPAAPASEGVQPAAAAAPRSRGGPQGGDVIDLTHDSEEEAAAAAGQPAPKLDTQPKQPEAPEAAQQQQGAEAPAAAPRRRRVARKNTSQQARPEAEAAAAAAQPLSRGAAAAAPSGSAGSFRLRRVAEGEGDSEEEADERAWRLPGHQWVQRGDIGGPPPHRPRDLLVLNTVIPYRRQYRAVTAAYLRSMRGAGAGQACGGGAGQRSAARGLLAGAGCPNLSCAAGVPVGPAPRCRGACSTVPFTALPPAPPPCPTPRRQPGRVPRRGAGQQRLAGERGRPAGRHPRHRGLHQAVGAG